MKKLFALLCTGLLLVSLVACSQNNKSTGNSTTGDFAGEAAGKGGIIKVSVHLEDGVLTKIDVLEQHETRPITKAMDLLSQEMIATNQVDVDSITGATITSSGFKGAVKDALSKAGIESSQLVAKEKEAHQAQTIEEEYDVVVIGAGGAGLVSAITAAEEGAKVAVMEKLQMAAGNTLLSGAEYAAANNWIQKKEGIEDSPETMMADMLKGGDNEGDPELVRVLSENATKEAEWLRDDVKVEWTDELMHFGGHSVKRSLVPLGATGEEIIGKLLKKAEELGIKIYYDTTAKKILSSEEGVANGVYGENSRGLGDKVTLHAKNGVIIATGGFGSSVEMRTKYNPEMGAQYKSTDSVADVGEGITMAESLNAQLEDMSFIQTYPMCDPLSGGLLYIDDARLYGYTMIVNKEGKRFMNELGRRDVMSKAILAQTDGVCYELMDETGFTNSKIMENHGGEVAFMTATKQFVKKDTLEEVAEFFGINVDEFKKSVETYNSYVEAGSDPEFEKSSLKAKIETAPYYIVKATPAVHHTMGGILINTKAEVLNTKKEVIPHLYAAGEVTGNIHGTNRLGSCALADLTVFGRIAGKEAASVK